MASQFWKTLVGKLTQTANVARFKAIDLSASKLKLTSALTKRLESSAELTSKLALILNDITGYTQCQLLKEQVDLKSKQYSENRKLIAEAKEEYEAAVKERSSAQRELSSLLQRKQLWTDDEVERFTVLYRSEIKLEQNESFCREKYNKMEKEQEATHNALMDAIRERYQEEQLWSDKIRRASTIGTFSLMTLNIFVFIILQVKFGFHLFRFGLNRGKEKDS